jgi:hypothetical protein
MTPTCNEITREMHSQFVEGTVDEGAECGGRVKCDKSGFKRGAGREKKLGKLRKMREGEGEETKINHLQFNINVK